MALVSASTDRSSPMLEATSHFIAELCEGEFSIVGCTVLLLQVFLLFTKNPERDKHKLNMFFLLTVL